MTFGSGVPFDRFAPGDRVVVVDGTFAGITGTILSPEELLARNPQARISRELREGGLCAVLLTIFGREVPVELQPWQVFRAE
jgi:transcription antitermination factor NusG